MATPKKAKVLADGSMSCKPSEFSRREELPETEEAQCVVAGVEDCMETGHSPDPTLPITGRYETLSNSEGHELLVSVNRAGLWLELWITKVLGRSTANRHVYRLSGIGADDIFELYEPWNLEKPVGKLVGVHASVDAARLQVDLEDYGLGISNLLRYSHEAVVSDGALLANEKALPEVYELEQRKPLHPSHVQWIEDVLTGSRLRGLMTDFFAIEVDHTYESAPKLADKILEIDTYLHKLLVDGYDWDRREQSLLRQLHDGDRVLFEFYAHVALHRFAFTINEQNKLVYHWLQEALRVYRDHGTPGAKLEGLRRYLAIEELPPASFEYRLELELVGIDAKVGKRFKAGKLPVLKRLPKKVRERIEKYIKDYVGGDVGGFLGGRGMVGTITVTKEAGETPGWTEWFLVAVGGARGSLIGDGKVERNFTLDAKGYCTTPTEWKPTDFPGQFVGFDGYMAEDRQGKRADNQFVWLLYGSGDHPSIQAVFDEVDTKLSKDMLGMQVGRIIEVPLTDTEKPRAIDKTGKVDYVIRRNLHHQSHFVTGSPHLSEDARMALRIVCANELAMLRSDLTEVLVVGFADRVDRRWYNESLSKMRARNTMQAMFDVAGDDIRAALEIAWKGERAAELYGMEDETDSHEFRRVEVIIGGRLVASLRVLDPKKSE